MDNLQRFIGALIGFAIWDLIKIAWRRLNLGFRWHEEAWVLKFHGRLDERVVVHHWGIITRGQWRLFSLWTRTIKK